MCTDQQDLRKKQALQKNECVCKFAGSKRSTSHGHGGCHPPRACIPFGVLFRMLQGLPHTPTINLLVARSVTQTKGAVIMHGQFVNFWFLPKSDVTTLNRISHQLFFFFHKI